MGSTQSSSSSIAIPVEEGLLPETGYYALADAVVTDSVLQRYGLVVRGVGNSSSSSSGGGGTAYATPSTSSSAAAVAVGTPQCFAGSGRMVKTFLMQTHRNGPLGPSSSSNTNTTNTTLRSNNTNDTNTNNVEVAAVLKAAWILEQTEPSTEGPNNNISSHPSAVAANNSTSTPLSSSSFQAAAANNTMSWIAEQAVELARIHRAVAPQPHVTPFAAWFLGDVRTVPRSVWHQQQQQQQSIATPPTSTDTATTSPPHTTTIPNSQGSTTTNSSSSLGTHPSPRTRTCKNRRTTEFHGGSPVVLRAAYLVRPAVYTTLADRLASRPWLTVVEKLWIASQILQALSELHKDNIPTSQPSSSPASQPGKDNENDSQGFVVHGFLTTENIGLTSAGWVLLLDIASYKALTALPDDDPSEYLQYFQPVSSLSSTTTSSSNAAPIPRQHQQQQKRCYLAPERFYNRTATTTSASITSSGPDLSAGISEAPLTPAMDIFSTGCILTELFLNGERCMDLGDLMEYRRANPIATPNATTAPNVLTPTLAQKLNKIESSAVRAACKHMLAVDPSKRLSAAAYWERLQAADQFPASFPLLTDIAQFITTGRPVHHKVAPLHSSGIVNSSEAVDESNSATGCFVLSPDARIAVLACEFERVLWQTVGVRDTITTRVGGSNSYFRKVLGHHAVDTITTPQNLGANPGERWAEIFNEKVKVPCEEEKSTTNMNPFESELSLNQMFASVEALLKELDSSVLPDTEDSYGKSVRTSLSERHNPDDDDAKLSTERTELCRSSLIIYLQFILSTMRHAQRPESKLVALQLVDSLSLYSSDESKLQRIVPAAVSLLQDQDPLVRASALQVLTSTVSTIETFPPSDSKIFPQYIFKRVAHLMSDPSLVVRLSFACSIAVIAETAHRFLDISHAVRLYELVGNGTNGTVSREETNGGNDRDVTVFGDEVTKLLDASSRVSSRVSLTTEQTEGSAETASVQSEAVSIATGKVLISNAYNADLTILHEILSRWVVHIMLDQAEYSTLSKRCILTDISRLCAFFGLEGVMSFILPQILAFLNERKDWELRASLFEHLPAVCHSIGRAATEEFVLPCVEIGLVDSDERVICKALSCLGRTANMGLLSRNAIVGDLSPCDSSLVGSSLLRKYGALLLFPSADIRHHAVIAFGTICARLGHPDCVIYAIPHLRPFLRTRHTAVDITSVEGLRKCLKALWSRHKVESTIQTIKLRERNALWSSGAWTSIGATAHDENTHTNQPGENETLTTLDPDPEEKSMSDYLKMLVRHSIQSPTQEKNYGQYSTAGLSNGIEGSLKLSQTIMFPRQIGHQGNQFLPKWYALLRESASRFDVDVSEEVSIRSVSTLGRVYGLSIIGTAEGTLNNTAGTTSEIQNSETGDFNVLTSTESQGIECFFHGEWGSETILDPELVDPCLLVTKLKSLEVPALPINLGGAIFTKQVGSGTKNPNLVSDWRPRPKTLFATSSTVAGHDAPITRLAVAIDQSFFVTASHDGTCRVWDIPQIDEQSGFLESSVKYSNHSISRPTKINDIAMIEGTYSVVSGASDGSVHVWRVDTVSTVSNTLQSEGSKINERRRAVGFSEIRVARPLEGEILAVSHFNSPSASIVTFATQKGSVHSWDLRCTSEPFHLQHSSELGYLTSMALGSDRNWIVTGTSRGYIALWDIRFHQCLQLWRHSSEAAIARLATSTVASPQRWGSSDTPNTRPYLFAAAGSNECGMFDAITGECAECFRTVAGDSRNLNADVDYPPRLADTPLASNSVKPKIPPSAPVCTGPVASINCMVGSIGASQQSYLVTGGSDCRIRFWDFSTPSKCFILSGQPQAHPRSSFERIDFEGSCRLMLCRQSKVQSLRDSGKIQQPMFHGLKKPENHHTDSILDIKVLNNNGIISCSRDCTVKIWR